jgi:hypothetical protein
MAAPQLDLSDDDVTALAMACRSAAHHARERLPHLRRGQRLEVSPAAFIALAERLEAHRAAVARQGMREVRPVGPEERARLGWYGDKGRGR